MKKKTLVLDKKISFFSQTWSAESTTELWGSEGCGNECEEDNEELHVVVSKIKFKLNYIVKEFEFFILHEDRFDVRIAEFWWEQDERQSSRKNSGKTSADVDDTFWN